jgi:hypothetical protein
MYDFSNLTDEEITQSIEEQNNDIQRYTKRTLDANEYIQELKEEQIYRKYGIRKGNVIQDTETTQIGIVSKIYDWRLTMTLIKKDGSIGKANRNLKFEDAKKLYDSYDEFTNTVDQLCES